MYSVHVIKMNRNNNFQCVIIKHNFTIFIIGHTKPVILFSHSFGTYFPDNKFPDSKTVAIVLMSHK